jgi:hypothetical protein
LAEDGEAVLSAAVVAEVAVSIEGWSGEAADDCVQVGEL